MEITSSFKDRGRASLAALQKTPSTAEGVRRMGILSSGVG
jgi:hypothetical protein